jgi:hypothetical protein
MSHTFAHGYALLIGVDENCATGYALPDVAKDIRALAEVLAHPQRCAYSNDNVKMLTGQEATRQGIVGGLGWLRECIEADASANATAIVYYSGHGIRKGSGESHQSYLVPYDFDAGMIELSALRATDFSRAVSALNPQRLLVVLDCCHAGGMGVKGMLPLPAGYTEAAIAPSLLMEGEAVFVGPKTRGAKGMEALAQGTGRAVLSSSTGKQLSYIRKDEQMSIFTYHLIEAFTGHAQPQEGATEVLVSDIMSHVWRRVPESAKSDWNKDQTPDYQVSGNFPIALLLGGKGLSKGQPAPDPLDLLAGERLARGEQHIQIATGSYIAQASGGSTATVSVNKPKD